MKESRNKGNEEERSLHKEGKDSWGNNTGNNVENGVEETIQNFAPTPEQAKNDVLKELFKNKQADNQLLKVQENAIILMKVLNSDLIDLE